MFEYWKNVLILALAGIVFSVLLILYLLDRMRQPRIRWVKGKLYLKMGRGRTSLFYLRKKVLRGETKLHGWTIAGHTPNEDGGKTRSLFHRYEPYAHGSLAVTRYGKRGFRPARKNDIIRMMKSWETDPGIPLEQWVKKVLGTKILGTSGKRLIKKCWEEVR